MPNVQENSRVLSRIGARELTRNELGRVNGGFITNLMTLDPDTGEIDQLRVD